MDVGIVPNKLLNAKYNPVTVQLTEFTEWQLKPNQGKEQGLLRSELNSQPWLMYHADPPVEL